MVSFVGWLVGFLVWSVHWGLGLVGWCLGLVSSLGFGVRWLVSWVGWLVSWMVGWFDWLVWLIGFPNLVGLFLWLVGFAGCVMAQPQAKCVWGINLLLKSNRPFLAVAT